MAYRTAVPFIPVATSGKATLFGVVIVAGLTVGCSSPRLDATTDETVKTSLAAMSKKLSPEDQQKLVAAMMTISTQSVFSGGLLGMVERMKSGGAPAAELLKPLHGKTASEIVAEGDRLQAEQKARRLADAATEVRELETKKAVAERARSELAKFEVQRSRFLMRKGRFMDQPEIHLTVKNGTNIAVSRAHFKGTLASAGRSVPWIQKTFNYAIAGGLEPNETATWNLEPNAFLWRVDAPADAVFTVTVERLDGPDEKPAFDGAWDVSDEKRLVALRAALTEG